MNSSILLGITTFAYMLSTLLYVALAVFRAPRIGPAATVSAVIGWIIQTAAIFMRWMESYQLGIGHAPLTNMYESVVFFAWTVALLYLIMEWKLKLRIMGAAALPFAFLAMAYASFSTDLSKSINPLIPALQSNWLIAHVVTCFVGYAAFAIAAALGILYLIKEKAGKRASENKGEISLPNIDDLIHKTMIFGFIWLSGGIITGAIWANSAWGTYWSWDPKETWSLITWFFYAITLHARYTRGWTGRRIAILAIAGFFSVLFTYYGVNFLLSGLHSYGSS